MCLTTSEAWRISRTRMLLVKMAKIKGDQAYRTKCRDCFQVRWTILLLIPYLEKVAIYCTSRLRSISMNTNHEGWKAKTSTLCFHVSDLYMEVDHTCRDCTSGLGQAMAPSLRPEKTSKNDSRPEKTRGIIFVGLYTCTEDSKRAAKRQNSQNGLQTLVLFTLGSTGLVQWTYQETVWLYDSQMKLTKRLPTAS